MFSFSDMPFVFSVYALFLSAIFSLLLSGYLFPLLYKYYMFYTLLQNFNIEVTLTFTAIFSVTHFHYNILSCYFFVRTLSPENSHTPK